jgi:TrmH family RNA methyltransferase
MPEKITSLTNTKIKSIVAFRSRPTRQTQELMLVEGVAEMSCAFDTKVVFKEIFICPEIWNPADQGKIQRILRAFEGVVYETTPKVFEKISYGERTEGILGLAVPVLKTLKDLTLRKLPLVVVVERVEKPGNLGAILRTADAVGVDAVMVCDGRTDVFNPNVIRASLGTVFTNTVVSASNQDVAEFLKMGQFKIYASSPQASLIYTQVDWTAPSAVVVGSEQEGLSDFWLKHATQTIKIPMNGKIDSLNVSVSTAVVLYEALRQRSVQIVGSK